MTKIVINREQDVTITEQNLTVRIADRELPVRIQEDRQEVMVDSPAQEIKIDKFSLIGPPFDRVGWTRIVDVLPQGGGDTVVDKVYDDPPGNTILQSCTSTSLNIKLVVESSFPRVTIQSTVYTLPLVGSIYQDTIDLTLSAAGDLSAEAISPDGVPAAFDTVAIAISVPPVIAAAIFTSGYPGSQTELKENDTFQLQVTADKAFDEVVISDFGAGKAASIPVAAGVSATVPVTIADRGDTPQLLGARVAVLDAATGASSATYDTDSAGSVDGTNVVNLNNLHPTVIWGSPTYPGSQQALKGSEQVTVPVTLANLDTVLFDNNSTGELSVTNPTTIEATKTVTRTGGTYNISADNLRATANRAANNATTTDTRVVNIANVAVEITVTPPAARLRSGGNDGTSIQNHTINLSGNQQLLSAPTLNEQSGGGTFIGSWVGGPSVWTRTLQVHDDDTKSTYAWQSLSATNLAGIVTTTITSGANYVLGGFVARTLTFPAYSPNTTMNVEVVTFSKLTAGIFTATNQPALKQPIGTPPPVKDGYTINSVGVKPTTVIWLDTAAVGSNSSGTAAITDVQETV